MTSPPPQDLHLEGAPDVDDPPGPATRRLLERQRETESSIVLYPNDLPVAFERARGAVLEDPDGNRYIDCFAGIGVTNVGHSNPYVVEGVETQTRKLVHTLDFPSEVRLDLIDRLDDILPEGLAGNKRVAFGGPTGSDAVEACMKLAKQVTGNTGFIAFRGSYHGGTHGALSLTAEKSDKEGYAPLLSNVQHLRYPYPYKQGIDPEEAVVRSLQDVREVLEDGYGGMVDPAAIFVEPVQGEGGIVYPPEGFLTGLRELADEHGVMLVIDEVQAGFGRTGEWFACEHEGVTPDAMPMAKAAGGIGLPLSMTAYREEFDVWGPGGHSGTFRGYLPGMVACMRAIDYIQDHDLLAHSRSIGADLLARFSDLAEETPLLGDVRGRGLYIGLEFVDALGRPSEEIALDVRRKAFRRGVLAWGGGREENVVRLIPPLVLSREQADHVAVALGEAVREVDREHAGT
jgi:diaminobutyrate-2-oxoglutarate transaminase